MFGFIKKKSSDQKAPEAEKKAGLVSRLRERLSRTRTSLTEGLSSLVLGKKSIDDELLEELETRLLLADVGVDATQEIIGRLTERVSRKQLADAEALIAALREELLAILEPVSKPLEIPAEKRPFVILMVGINGAGKTTTIGKLAKQLQNQGRSVMLAAGDTFRAAAVEQLQVWGERNDIPVVAQQSGADSAAVIHDALQAARSRNVDVLIADTAGRLHTQQGLMGELAKVKRVIQKLDPLLGLTGITITKLDGTAKGGVLFAIARKLGVPIRFIGIGEGIDDLRVFDAAEFVDALFDAR